MNAQQFLREAVASQKWGPIPEAVLKMLAQTVNETAEINKNQGSIILQLVYASSTILTLKQEYGMIIHQYVLPLATYINSCNE